MVHLASAARPLPAKYLRLQGPCRRLALLALNVLEERQRPHAAAACRVVGLALSLHLLPFVEMFF